MMLGLFDALGVCALLGAKATLLTKILWTKNCSGISGKTQILYTLAFAARYLDLASSYYIYPINVTLFKITLLALVYSIVLSIYFFHYDSYQGKYDKFKIELLIFSSLVLALLANYGSEIEDVFWAFSVYLETLAIIPQHTFVGRAGRLERIVSHYVNLLALHKSIQIMSQVYRHFYAPEQFDRITMAAGLIQLMLLCHFFGQLDELEQQQLDAATSDLENGFKQEQFVHPKEIEAAKSAAESAAALAARDQLDRAVPTAAAAAAAATVVNRQEEELGAVGPVPDSMRQEDQKVNTTSGTPQEDKKTYVNMPAQA